MLYEETIEKGTLALIRALSADNTLRDFVLVGGTALALQLGHRKSLDIDLFNNKDIDSRSIADHLSRLYGFKAIGVISNGVFGFIEGVKIDMVVHKHAWIEPVHELDRVRMASLEDIAATKLNAIVGSGARLKDFVDVYFLLEYRTMEQMTSAYVAKYPDMNPSVAKNALLFHEDIAFQNKVDLLQRNPLWSEVAERLRQAVMEPKRKFEQATTLKEALRRDQESDRRKRRGKSRGR